MTDMLRSPDAQLDAATRRELIALIEDYPQGLVPMVVPLTPIRYHVGRVEVEQPRSQHGLEPHRKPRRLRNPV
jgi:uncharacterized protein YbgA (DUF1722 family)